MKNDDFDVTIPHKFVARPYQIPFLREVSKAMRGESPVQFFYQVWHRRSGKDKSNMADVVPRRLIQDPAQVKYVYPTSVMGRSNLWEALDKDGFPFIGHIPEKIRVGDPNETRMVIKVKNGTDTPSNFQVVGANKPDALRGGNPKLFIFSEWADHDPYALDVIEPIVRENKGIVIFNTTPKGDNHARALLESAKGNPLWWTQTLTVDDTGIFTPDEMKRIKEDTIKRFEAQGRSRQEAEAFVEQEYYCSFDSPVVGAYYGAAMVKAEREGRITSVPYNESLPVHTAWDLGIDDSMTIWFFQVAGREFHFIDYYENSGEGLRHYIKILQERDYVYGQHIAPHDISVKELGTGKSRFEVAKNLGLKFEVAPKLRIDDGIDSVRAIINRCYFDSKKTFRGIQALKNYRKEWNEKDMVFRTNPKHDWSSHAADSMRTFATGFIPKVAPPQGGQQGYGGVLPLAGGIG